MSARERDLELSEDVARERLVLAAEPTGVGHALAEMARSAWRAFSELARELGRRPRSLRELIGSIGVGLLVTLCAALVLLALFMAVVGVGLVVVTYAIGAWLIAWLLVREAARWVIDGGQPSRRPRLQTLSLRRDAAKIEWGSPARSCPFSSLSGMRVSVLSRPGRASEIALRLLTADAASQASLHFSVKKLDREEEAFDLCMRMARVLGWSAYATERDQLLGLEIELRPELPLDRQHPFRSYAAEPRYRAIEGSTSAADWSATTEPGFREPSMPLPSFEPASLQGTPARIVSWEPGRLVEFRIARPVPVAQLAWAQLSATLVGALVTLSVIVMINAASGQSLLWTQQASGRFSLAGVVGTLTAASACVGWLLALVLLGRRTGKRASVFDWTGKQLTVRDDDGSHAIAFADLAELVLTETADHRLCLELAARGRSPLLLLETEPSAAPLHQPLLSLAVDLARALGIAWRCVRDSP